MSLPEALPEALLAELDEVAKRHGFKFKPLGWCSSGSAECVQMLGDGAMYVTDSERDGNDLPFFAIIKAETSKPQKGGAA